MSKKLNSYVLFTSSLQFSTVVPFVQSSSVQRGGAGLYLVKPLTNVAV